MLIYRVFRFFIYLFVSRLAYLFGIRFPLFCWHLQAFSAFGICKTSSFLFQIWLISQESSNSNKPSFTGLKHALLSAIYVRSVGAKVKQNPSFDPLNWVWSQNNYIHSHFIAFCWVIYHFIEFNWNLSWAFILIAICWEFELNLLSLRYYWLSLSDYWLLS